MKRIAAAICVSIMAAATAVASPIFTDNFEDGSYNNPPPSAANPTWQVLLLPGLNDGHDQRWTVTDSSPIAGNFSVLWKDTPCQGQAGLSGDCFPAGVLYVDPAPNRPGTLGNYFIRFTTRITQQPAANLNPLVFAGDHFTYAAAPGILLFPPDQSGLAGGYTAGLVYNAGPDVDPLTPGFQDDPADDKIEVGIIYLEGNVKALTLQTAVLLRKPANMSVSDFFASKHDIQMNVRGNRFIEITVDGQYYGRADTSGTFTDAKGNPFTPQIRPQNTQDVAMVGLAGNENRYDSVQYDNAPPPDANGNGIPDIFEGAPDRDCDGITDAADPDDDNDGIPDFADPTPIGDPPLPDLDGDGLPDQCDPDVDNDGCPNAQDPNPNPNPPDCSTLCIGGSGFSFDCDGDGVANDCEQHCGTNPCDAKDFCDTTPPSITFVEPRVNSLYLQDSMSTFLFNGFGATAPTSITVKARITDSPGSGVNSVSFFVDNNPVSPADVNLPEPPIYSFKYRLDGNQTGDHQIKAVATDNQSNTSARTTPLRVIDLSQETDKIATDVTDQYSLLIVPLDPALPGSNGYAIRSNGGVYRIQYRVVEYSTVANGTFNGLFSFVTTCHPNVLFAIGLEGTVNGLTTPTAFPGFWHDPAFTLDHEVGSCSNGVYLANIPAAKLATEVNKPVGFWAFVDVPDRVSTMGPLGTVNSASGFFNIGKLVLFGSEISDRLDEEPTPVLIEP